jgi:DNA-binding CsgD family transcriptional regulator
MEVAEMPRVPKALTAERESKAIELRKAGASYEQIGLVLGISHEGARKAVLRVLARLEALTIEEAETLRAIQLLRINDMRRAIWAQARSGHLASIDRVIRLDEREARLTGIEAPDRTLISGDLHIIVEYYDTPLPDYSTPTSHLIAAPAAQEGRIEVEYPDIPLLVPPPDGE